MRMKVKTLYNFIRDFLAKILKESACCGCWGRCELVEEDQKEGGQGEIAVGELFETIEQIQAEILLLKDRVEKLEMNTTDLMKRLRHQGPKTVEEGDVKPRGRGNK